MIQHFERNELAALSGLTANALNVLVVRRSVPTLVEDPHRCASTAFDALMMTTADLFARDYGYDRRFVADVLHQNLGEFHHLAVRVDAGEPGLCAFIGQTARHCHVMGGNLQEIINRLPSMPAPTRMCIVSVSEAARMVRDRAAKAGIDTGDRFALTRAEAAEIAALPFGRRNKRKPEGKGNRRKC